MNYIFMYIYIYIYMLYITITMRLTSGSPIRLQRDISDALQLPMAMRDRLKWIQAILPSQLQRGVQGHMFFTLAAARSKTIK